MSRLDARLVTSLTADLCSPTARHVLLVLTIVANAKGFVTMPVANIADMTGLRLRTVQRALGALARAGHLTRYSRSRSPWTIHVHPKGL